MSDVRCQMSDVRCQMSDVRCQNSEQRGVGDDLAGGDLREGFRARLEHGHFAILPA
jgi:hypothetical protein